MRAIVQPRLTVLEHLRRGTTGAEIGVFKGDFSAAILRQVAPKKLYLIDPWLSQDQGSHRKAMYGSDNRSQHDMDKMAEGVRQRFSTQINSGQVQICRDTSVNALTGLPDNSLDWTYIDGDHTYEAVLQDLKLSVRKVRKSGYICGDDYQLGNWFADGVIRALHDFLAVGQSRVILAFLIGNQFVVKKLGDYPEDAADATAMPLLGIA